MNAPVQDGSVKGEPPVTSPNHKITDALASFSLANLCLISAWFSLLYDADHGYFNHAVVNQYALVALALNIIIFTLFSWCVLRWARHAQKPWLRLGCDLILVFLLVLPMDFCRRQVFEMPDYKVLAFIRNPAGMLGIASLLLFCLWQHRRVARVVVMALVILSPLAFMTLSKAAMVSLGMVRLDQATEIPRLQPMTSVTADQPRVVWIIFDETDYRLGFDHRPPTLQMPAFDRLLGEALYATHAMSPADCTLFSMPSLISGHRVCDAGILNHSDLSLVLADERSRTNWSSLPSVFGEARTLGYNTALVGWYHPYDRVLSRDLNYCAWHPLPGYEPVQSTGLFNAILSQWESMAGNFRGRWFYINLCRSSLEKSCSVVTNSAYGLSLLHLAPPHKPSVYDPAREEYTLFNASKIQGYYKNLALADRFLGQLRHAMEESGQWNRTWLIVSSDHSWRESPLVDGQRDLRVPFIVKAPAQSRSILYTNQMNTVLTHDLILAILRRDITTPDQTVTWLNAHAVTNMPIQNQGSKFD